MKNSWLFSPNGKGMTLSIGLHLVVLGLAYCIQHVPARMVSSGSTYSIAVQSAPTYTVPEQHPSNHSPQPQRQSALPIATHPDRLSKHQLKKKRLHSKPSRQKQPNSFQEQKKRIEPRKAPKIDERGLYNRGKKQAKQAGVTLELKGWEWDAVPNPNDTTEEFGKIVFEIKVDQNGEIISMRTIEKTVTPMVEKIYADALRALTFSKTAETPYGIGTGKVTFVLIGK